MQVQSGLNDNFVSSGGVGGGSIGGGETTQPAPVIIAPGPPQISGDPYNAVSPMESKNYKIIFAVVIIAIIYKVLF